jgi:hypothetical protein
VLKNPPNIFDQEFSEMQSLEGELEVGLAPRQPCFITSLPYLAKNFANNRSMILLNEGLDG